MTDEQTIIELLAEYFEEEADNISQIGDHVFEVGSAEYLVYSGDEADKAVEVDIRELLWAFNPSFLSGHLKGGMSPDMIEELIGDRCESINEVIFALVEDFDDLVDDAVSSDGRGHFLASYDHEEHEIGDDLWAYRVN